ncbi:hypothetical protein TTHERM_00263240 (macronuclear) [Tetrahymena thermophila SB210]|uniref:Uncharacterized protein n=1 Tax=Tetrahymena thermophila (strain SB210) TaxID=312017 RepID=Q22U59_TETTS|nr:hypothetical protein TTHERM_00263240 [Tetrahymena thermophila SB210]EAR88828.1 hypothetical protein TTHERM_00263240 [Tetrahymena thermophila SB210]|eukprot:XP_001009073.1 hypothetical protein TTHERM_00263240 [Tetrahymena thermophila SB210]
MSDIYQYSQSQKGQQHDNYNEDLLSEREIQNNLDEQNYFQHENDNEFTSQQEYYENIQNYNNMHSESDNNQKVRDYLDSNCQQNKNGLNQNNRSKQNSFSSNLEKTVNLNANYQMRTPLTTTNSLRVSQKAAKNQDEVLTQGKSSKSLQEQFIQQEQHQNMPFRISEKNQKSQIQKLESQESENYLVFDNNNLFFVIGEIYKKIQNDGLFQTLKSDETSREYLHYRVQEILQDSYVKSLIQTLKEMQRQLNYQVGENIRLQEIIVNQEEKQQYHNDQLQSYQQKCSQLEDMLADIQQKDEERSKEIRQLYLERNNSEKSLLEKYEALQEQNNKLDKKNHELQVQLQQLTEKQQETGEVKSKYQEQVVQSQMMKNEMEKLQLDIMQREQEILRIQTKLQDANEKYEKDIEEINQFYEKELKLMKTQRKKEKEMYEKILEERNNLNIVQNTSQSSQFEQLNNQIQEFSSKLSELEDENQLMRQEYQNLQSRMQDMQEVHKTNIEQLKLLHKSEINDMKKIQEKIEQLNSDLQKDYSLLKQSKQMSEASMNEKHQLEKHLLNDQISKIQLELQTLKLQKESFGKEIIEITQILEKEKSENSKLLYRIQILQERDSQDTNQLRRKIEELEILQRKSQKEIDQFEIEREKNKMELREKDELIKQKNSEFQEIIKRLSKAQQKFEEIEKRSAEVQEEKNNLYRLLDSKSKEMKRLEDETQKLQKSLSGQEKSQFTYEATIAQLNQQIKLLIEQKDNKASELKNVSKEVRSVQKEMEICREMNIQNQQKLLQHEEEERRLRDIEIQQKDVIMQLSSRVEQLEFELLHVREEYDHKENIFKQFYENQIEKMNQQISEGIAKHLQVYANQSNSQLIQLLKDNQVEIQEQESLVNKQFAEITYLKEMNQQLNNKLLQLIQARKNNYSPSQYEAIVRENQHLKEINKGIKLNQEESTSKRTFDENQPVHLSYNSILSPRISEVDPSKKSSEQTSPRVDILGVAKNSEVNKKAQAESKIKEDLLQAVFQRLDSIQQHFIQEIHTLNQDHHLQSDEIKQQYSRMKNSQAQDKKTHSMLKQQFTQKLVDVRQVLYGDIKDTLINYRKELSSIKEYASNNNVLNKDVISNINKQINYIEQIDKKTDSSSNQSPNQDTSNGENSQTPINNVSQFSKSNSNPKLSPQNQSYNHFKNNSIKQEKYLKQFSIEEENSSLSESNYQNQDIFNEAKQPQPSNQQSFKKKIQF